MRDAATDGNAASSSGQIPGTGVSRTALSPANAAPKSYASSSGAFLRNSRAELWSTLCVRRRGMGFWSPKPAALRPRSRALVAVAPEPGLMLLWPAWLHHAVLPAAAARARDGTAPRVSVAFNLNLA